MDVTQPEQPAPADSSEDRTSHDPFAPPIDPDPTQGGPGGPSVEALAKAERTDDPNAPELVATDDGSLVAETPAPESEPAIASAGEPAVAESEPDAPVDPNTGEPMHLTAVEDGEQLPGGSAQEAAAESQPDPAQGTELPADGQERAVNVGGIGEPVPPLPDSAYPEGATPLPEAETQPQEGTVPAGYPSVPDVQGPAAPDPAQSAAPEQPAPVESQEAPDAAV